MSYDTGGWYLQIPTLWQEHLVLTRSAVAGSTLGYRFLWEAGGSTEELLTIAALSASDLSALGDGWQVLTQKGETVYVCRLARRAVALGITADAIRTQFHFIQNDWKTGVFKSS